jgi:exopolyphosphatase/guanosine-5'-triphosphate,3'-diphosphate pyrophosphatase
MNRIAIIDLGTNTFNLLIVEVNPDKTYQSLFQTKISVKLGEGGINKGIILPAPFQRGIDALNNYKDLIEKYKVKKVHAFGTSALRDASNGKTFLDTVKQETGIEVQTISGQREAELIYYGVRSAVKMEDALSLIIDIGGGSTEFIIANKNGIEWKYSFLLGAARLLERFNPSDPISDKEIHALNRYLKQELKPLFEAIEKCPVIELIGASGSFDSFAEMIACRFYSPEILRNKTEYTFNLNDFEAIHQSIIRSTKAERSQMKGLIAMRIDMIVISSLLVQLIISSFAIKKMRLSSYSLKEGVLHELLSA